MTKRILFLTMIIACGYILSCSKSADRPAPGFTWNWDDSIPGLAKLHKAFPLGFGNTAMIMATDDTVFDENTARVIVKLPSFNVGTYNITDTGKNTLLYRDTDTSYQALSGKFNITTWYGDALAGDFSVMLLDTLGVPRTLKGRFRSTPVEK